MRGCDDIIIQGNGSIPRQGPSIDGRPGIQGDGSQRQHVPREISVRAEGGRTADLEKNIAGLHSVDQRHAAVRRGGQGAADLKDKQRLGIAQQVEREGAGQLGRGEKKYTPGTKVRPPRS